MIAGLVALEITLKVNSRLRPSQYLILSIAQKAALREINYFHPFSAKKSEKKFYFTKIFSIFALCQKD
jgi:hypothetical protein